MDLIELGGRFRELRRLAGDTQSTVAERAGMDRTTVAKFETGQLAELGVGKLERLFQLYGFSIEPVPVRPRPTLDDLQARGDRGGRT
ncbi:MAG: helix-turn-helix domain-containing protein [Alcanivorax sp.]|nr:helix-turn-helix domain-containing protein [Alcanivorax sp.]